jgi:hypothetical protein
MTNAELIAWAEGQGRELALAKYAIGLERRVATLVVAGVGLRDAANGMAERYAEMFHALGLGDPADSVALQDSAVAIAAWERALLKEGQDGRTE